MFVCVCVCVGGGVTVPLICFVCSKMVEQGTHRDCLTRSVSGGAEMDTRERPRKRKKYRRMARSHK